MIPMECADSHKRVRIHNKFISLDKRNYRIKQVKYYSWNVVLFR